MRGLLAALAVAVGSIAIVAGTGVLTHRVLVQWAGTTAVVKAAAVRFHEPFHGRPFETVRPLDQDRWELFAGPGVSVRTEIDGLRLDVPASTPGWLRPRLPLLPPLPWRDGPTATATTPVESLQWEARVETDALFFLVAELRFEPARGSLLLQATPVDVQVSDLSGAEESSDSLPLVVANDGRFHLWSIGLGDRELVLRLDGSVRWRRTDPSRLAMVQFGEVRTDDQHGGRMWLRDVTYVRRGG